MPLNYAEADGETHPIALRSLRSVERLKYSLADLVVHPASSISKRDDCRLSFACCCNRQTTAVRHRVKSVDDHIDEHFTYRRLIAEDQRALARTEDQIVLDACRPCIVAPSRARQVQRIANCLIEIGWPRRLVLALLS